MLKHGLKLGVALALALCVWEAVLRAWVWAPAPYHQSPRLGWMPRPHAVGFTGIEGRVAARYNALGFRDGEVIPRQKSELRVLFLGDSFVEALNVHEHEMMSRRLQELLQEQAGGRRVRVFNGGRAGVSIAAAVEFAPEYKRLFDPDVVVLLVRDQWNQMFDPLQEVRYAEKNGGFEIETRWRSERLGGLAKKVDASGVLDWSVVSYGKRQLNTMRNGQTEPAMADALQADAPGAGEKSDDRGEGAAPAKGAQSSRVKSDPNLGRSLRAAEWTARQLREAYPRLLVLHVPEAYDSLHGMIGVSPTERRFLQACRELNTPTVDMRPLIEADFARTQVPPYGFSNTLPWRGHFNAYGHEMAARALAQAIAARPGWLQPAR